MPEISRFFGIVILMYYRNHPPPHFHARHGEHEAKFSIVNGEIIEGFLPGRAASLVAEWYALHVAELTAAWDAAASRQLPNKIDPLE
jgi:Domain of unknown function (DUF4160)